MSKYGVVAYSRGLSKSANYGYGALMPNVDEYDRVY